MGNPINHGLSIGFRAAAFDRYGNRIDHLADTPSRSPIDVGLAWAVRYVDGTIDWEKSWPLLNTHLDEQEREHDLDDVLSGLALHMDYRWTHRRSDGSILDQTPWQKSESLVEQFIQILRVQMRQASDTAVVDTTSTSRTVAANAGNFRSTAAAGTDTYGLTVGTGSGAVGLTNRALTTKVAHGTAATQLEYRATVISAPTNPTGNELRLMIDRQYNNASGGSIIIAEAAWEAQGTDGTTTWNFLLSRDLISPTQTILNGNTATLTHRLYVDGVGLIGLLRTLYNLIANASVSQVRADGVTDNSAANGVNLGIQNVAEGTGLGRDARGIVLGTGAGAFSPTSSALTTWIDSGVTAGRLNYLENFFGSVTSNRRFTHRRASSNGSGGSIIVSEAGENLRVFFDQDRTVLGLRTLATAMTPSGNLTIADLGAGVFEYIHEI